MDDTKELKAEIQGLRALTSQRFDGLAQRLDAIVLNISQLVTKERFESWTKRLEYIEVKLSNQDSRVVRVERVIWLLGIMGTLALTILTAMLIAWATGKIGVAWR